MHGFCCIAPLDGQGNFTLAVADSGVPCTGGVNCGGGGGCDVVCNGTSENEPVCFDDYDDIGSTNVLIVLASWGA